LGGRLVGVYTAMITPFNERGEVDETALRDLIEFQIENGVDGLVPCGTTGESPTLSHAEHDRVIEITIEQVGRRVPVIAGTGSNSTAEAVRLSQQAMKAGADAIMLVNPYYNKPTQKGLFLHFQEVARSVSLPCVIYNIKGRTGVNLETETLMRLCDACSNILAVKEASGDLQQMKAVIARRRPDFSVLSGDDNMALALVSAGGDGVISVASNLVPDKMVALIHGALRGELETAQSLDTELSDYSRRCF
jgi:4-hydroxy-tetrahydrodipicolinate synthase